MKAPFRATVSRENHLIRIVFAGLAVLLGLGLSGCGSISPVPTVSLQAAATQIKLGESVVLTWTSTNATSVSLDPSIGAAALPVSGSAKVTPESTTSYKITATGAGGSVSSTVTVIVIAPPTVTLTAIPSTIMAGSNATLTWATTNATAVSIDPSVGTGPLPVNGSTPVSPATTTTYTITATGAPQTAAATASVTVTVRPVTPGIPKSEIQHLIVLVMQNHSFDNLFGTYSAQANGLDPSAPSYTQAACGSSVPPCVPTSATVSPTLLTTLTTADLHHDGPTYTAAYDGGKMDKYALTNGDLSMQYFDSTSTGTAKDGQTFKVGTLWSYAQQYALADNFFASAMNSEPANMLYMIAATVHDVNTSGKLPFYDKCSAKQAAQNGGKIAPALTETTVGDQMNAHGITWTWYQGNYTNSQNGTCTDYVPQENVFQYFTSTQYSANLQDFDIATFKTSLTDGSLPAVSFITAAPFESMHPGSGDMASGIEFIDTVVKDVQNSPSWASTAIVLLWDESGGWYDHVPPPQLVNTVGLGARVPVIVISPFAKMGAISHQQMDFVSILRFIQWNWGLGTFPDPTQNAREQQTGDLCDLLTTTCASP